MLAKLKPLPKADDVPCADDAPKIDCVPKADELAGLKEGAVLTENAGVDPNKEEVVDDVEPKGLDVFVVPNGEEPNAEVVVVPKGLLNPGVF